MKLMAVRAGVVRLRESPHGQWRTAIEKHRVESPVKVIRTGIAVDEQADLVNHGGPEKAVLAYSVDHYSAWRDELGLPEFGPGAMGENFEMSGQTERDACVGDTYRMGDVVLQLAQPRQPCWKPALLNGVSDLTSRIAETGRTGWYLRVLVEGMLAFPCEVEVAERPHPDWTVERANRLVYHKAEGREARLELAALPELSLSWRKWLRGEG